MRKFCRTMCRTMCRQPISCRKFSKRLLSNPTPTNPIKKDPSFSVFTKAWPSSLTHYTIPSKDWYDFIEEAKKRRYNLRNWAIGAVGFSSLVIYLFYEKITDHASKELSRVTNKSLEHNMDELTKNGKHLVMNLAQDPEIRTTLANLFIDIFKTPQVKQAASDLAHDVVHEILTKQEYEHLQTDLAKILAQVETKVVFQLANDPKIQQQLGNLMWSGAKYALTPRFFVSDQKIQVSDQKIQVSDQKIQVSDQKIQVSDQKIQV